MRQKLLLIVSFVGAVFIFTGCQNAYSQFYTPYLQEKLEPTDKVEYYTYKNDEDISNVLSKGHKIIGYSGFTSTQHPTKEEAISQAKKIGADVVVATWKFQNTENQTIPIVNYTPGTTSTTYANANAYGSNGSSAYGYGTSTRYTQGSYSTSYVQSTAHRYEYAAYYLKKIDTKKFILGVEFDKITTEMSQKTGTNAGCPIKIVYVNTPAFYNDLISGDIILKANDKKVFSCEELKETLKNSKVISLDIWRSGAIISKKDITLNK